MVAPRGILDKPNEDREDGLYENSEQNNFRRSDVRGSHEAKLTCAHTPGSGDGDHYEESAILINGSQASK